MALEERDSPPGGLRNIARSFQSLARNGGAFSYSGRSPGAIDPRMFRGLAPVDNLACFPSVLVDCSLSAVGGRRRRQPPSACPRLRRGGHSNGRTSTAARWNLFVCATLSSVDKPTTEQIREAVLRALEFQARNAADLFQPPKNSRKIQCKVDGCGRPAYAKGLCNAHYIRSRNGREIGAPVRARKRSGLCEFCGVESNGKGGWGLCRRHYRAARYVAIKDSLVALFGGKCAACLGSFHRAAFDFHHDGDEKDSSPSYVIAGGSASVIATELARCVLLCANCHRIEHANDGFLRADDGPSVGA